MKGVEMIIGKVDFVYECPLLSDHTFQEYQILVETEIDKLKNVSLILTDMFGGTPNTVGLLMSRKFNIPVICGLNAPLLITSCLMIQNDKNINTEQILSETSNSIFDASKKIGLTIEEKI